MSNGVEMACMKIKAIFGVSAVLLASACSKEDNSIAQDSNSETVTSTSVLAPPTTSIQDGLDFRIKCSNGTQITVADLPGEITLDQVPDGSDSIAFKDPNVVADYAAIFGSLGILEENATSEGFVIPPDAVVSDFAIGLQRVEPTPKETFTAVVFYNYSNGRGLSDTFKAISMPDPQRPGIGMKDVDTKVEIHNFTRGQEKVLEMVSISDETGELVVEEIGDESNPLKKTHLVNGRDGNLLNLDCDYFKLNKEVISI